MLQFVQDLSSGGAFALWWNTKPRFPLCLAVSALVEHQATLSALSCSFRFGGTPSHAFRFALQLLCVEH
ncbi:hypothetical protein [Paenibacillus sp. FSL H8-0332]|uniref:hypothetical protein n=1 Tax=Paenibacillus sp. FSL H8-0332 TaxID=2954742 RepID=UPI0030CFA3AC